jgi:SH3-like domain-containing protein
MKAMKIWLILTLFLGSIAACQKSDVRETPQTPETSPTETSPISASPLATTQTPQSLPATTPTPQALNTAASQPSPQPSNRVATIQNSSASSQKTCQISAYIIDKDPKGLNVRSGPGNDYKILGTLPTNTLAVIVSLTGSQGDWVQLSKAQGAEKIEFQGSGWVYAPLLGTSTRGYATKSVSVYSAVNSQSQVIGTIPSQRGTKLLSCDRDWALVEYESLKGWIAPEAQCPNPLTTCP